MRQKQKPFFSTLEEIELDILAREAKKEDHPSEEVLTESVAEPIEVRPSTAADVVTEPPSDLFRISEIQILEKEKTKESFPSEEVLTKTLSSQSWFGHPPLWLQIRFPNCPEKPESALAMLHLCISRLEHLSWEVRNMSRVEEAMKCNMKSP